VVEASEHVRLTRHQRSPARKLAEISLVLSFEARTLGGGTLRETRLELFASGW
jgi:hypothetical protein